MVYNGIISSIRLRIGDLSFGASFSVSLYKDGDVIVAAGE
jgi:hypothetical protein